MSLNANVINDGVQTVKNLSQVAANLTKPAPKPQQPQEKKQETTNQPHTQTVEVKVGEQSPNPKPVIVKEKSETHVHHHFPENRELSDRECAVRELELKQNFELETKRLEMRSYEAELDRRDRKEREEREEKDRQRRREDARRRNRRAAVVAGVVGVAGLAVIGYCVYTDSRRPGGPRLSISWGNCNTNSTPAEQPIKVEGKVK